MINCNFNLTVSLYEDSLKDYMDTIEDIETISISDISEMVEWEACKEFNKGDLVVGRLEVVNPSGESVDFNTWFDNYIKQRGQ